MIYVKMPDGKEYVVVKSVLGLLQIAIRWKNALVDGLRGGINEVVNVDSMYQSTEKTGQQ